MDKKDLLTSSPVRYFEPTGAMAAAGEMGLITAKKGLGKTSILVQFGLDSLLAEKGLVHVSFDQKSSNVIAWYTSVLTEICKNKNVDVEELASEIMKNRTILNFNQETFTLPKVVSTLKALKDGGIKLDTVIVDDLDLEKVAASDIQAFADFIKAGNMTAWFSYNSECAQLDGTLAADKLNAFASVAHLAPVTEGIELAILKKGSGKVNLNSKTLLMSK